MIAQLGLSSGGGWAYYVGQEKLRPQPGWLPVAFASGWTRPPRQMNGTSYFYAHSDQWRYERMELHEQISPLADPKWWSGTMIDCNVRAEWMGWPPSAPRLTANPSQVALYARAAGQDPADYVAQGLKSGAPRMAREDGAGTAGKRAAGLCRRAAGDGGAALVPLGPGCGSARQIRSLAPATRRVR